VVLDPAEPSDESLVVWVDDTAKPAQARNCPDNAPAAAFCVAAELSSVVLRYLFQTL
jgi:hypothetical protein